jgi:hypothetical protein
MVEPSTSCSGTDEKSVPGAKTDPWPNLTARFYLYIVFYVFIGR